MLHGTNALVSIRKPFCSYCNILWIVFQKKTTILHFTLIKNLNRNHKIYTKKLSGILRVYKLHVVKFRISPQQLG